ncbi:MAG: hypothetical protein D4R43_02705 [Sphingobacteriales bacterium]|nr:MAG: hypothetical protein D4R43_02705 [Sphingobacteriales bacterium]
MKTLLLIFAIIISSIYNSHTVTVKDFKATTNKYLNQTSLDTLIIKVKKKDFDAEIIAACQGWQEIIKCGNMDKDIAWSKVNNKKIISWKTYMAISSPLNAVKKDIDAMNLKVAMPFELIGYVMTKKDLKNAYFIYINEDECLQALYRGTHIEYKVIVGENSNNYRPGCTFLCKE